MHEIPDSIRSSADAMCNEAHVTLSSADGVRNTADGMRNSVALVNRPNKCEGIRKCA